MTESTASDLLGLEAELTAAAENLLRAGDRVSRLTGLRLDVLECIVMAQLRVRRTLARVGPLAEHASRIVRPVNANGTEPLPF